MTDDECGDEEESVAARRIGTDEMMKKLSWLQPMPVPEVVEEDGSGPGAGDDGVEEDTDNAEVVGAADTMRKMAADDGVTGTKVGVGMDGVAGDVPVKEEEEEELLWPRRSGYSDNHMPHDSWRH